MPTIDDIVKQIVLAHADGEISSISVVFTNKEGEPELKQAVDHMNTYAVYFCLGVAQASLMSAVLNGGAAIDPEVRE